MKKSHFHYEVLNFSVCNDYITYPSLNYEIKSHFPMQNIGIFILEIISWEDSVELINQLYRYSLIDSFSLQIEINKEVRLYLLLKILGIGATELKFRYYNLKNHLQKKFSSISFLCDKQLETVYLSIIGTKNKTALKNDQITRDKRHYFFSNNGSPKFYYLLYNLDVISTTQNASTLKILTELLQASNISCSLIMYSKNLGDSTQSNYYLFAMHPNYENFNEQLNDILTQYNLHHKLNDIFHPDFLGRILTRGPIDSKFLQKTTLPPIFNVNLLFSENSSENQNPNSIDRLLQGIPYEKSLDGFYRLYNGEVILFIVKKLNIVSIKLISKNLTDSFHQCIIYFENEKDYHIFKKKIEKTNNIQKTIGCYQLSELRTVIKKLKIRNKEQEIADS
ncbi:MAG: hypothetical protein EU530_06465 [Promethearchaeota archaeon]|nr:MAG: hypothetical protein EU530_06465 [Candidatus Lokiarchaeota archaeon]